MSPHAVNNFVSDLVLMAQAMEKLPQVERELEEARRIASDWIKTCENVQADLAQSRHYAAGLEQKVHDLEVARDDAELSFLEADERTSRALDFVKALFGNAGALIQALEPPKAAAPQVDSPSKPDDGSMYELVREQPPLAAQLDSPYMSQPIGVSVSTDPTANHATAQSGAGSQVADASIGGNTSVAAQLHSHPVGEHSAAPSSAYASDGTISPGEAGQRESDPTSAPRADISSMNASSGTASTQEVASSPPSEEPEALPGPYHGKRYWDEPVYVSETAWLTGGGTLEDYHWRPQRNIFS